MSTRLSLLVDLASQLAREVDLDALLDSACVRIAEAMHADRATVWLVDSERGDLFARVAVMPELSELRLARGSGLAGFVAREGVPVRLDAAAEDPRFDASIDRATGYRTESLLAVPIRDEGGAPVRGVLQVLNKKGGEAFDVEDERYLLALALQLGRALSLTTLRPREPAAPGVTRRGPFNRIIGRSEALERVYERVHKAAATDATVLFRGETGTGKGLFARAVHVNSKRQSAPMVTIDCTTLPAQLVESELFGHERGAFTGADRRVRGRVELAEGGTLFLDEVGDLPPDAQGKLLRFLQEQRFERVGGRETLSGDVRIVAATHRPLEQLVAEGRFREDLYYRLRVVEIELPPLRARGKDEVLRLARHFVEAYARRYDMPRGELTAAAEAVLVGHSYPGNVRELEHWIESAVVIAQGGPIDAAHLPSPRAIRSDSVSDAPSDGPIATLDEAMSDYARRVLERCGGNKSEASRALSIGRNTLARLLERPGRGARPIRGS